MSAKPKTSKGEVTNRVRGSTKITRYWKKAILLRDKRKCRICSYGKKLVVHHDKERMSDIINRFFPNDRFKLSLAEETFIVGQIEYYHILGKVSGAVLCRSCHDEVHKEERESICYVLIG